MKPLLFLAPTAPVPGGHGLGMRALAVLRALSRRRQVFLLVLNHPPTDAEERNACEALCAECAYVPIGLWSRLDSIGRRLAAVHPALYSRLFPEPCEWGRAARAGFAFPFREREFGTVHVFRTYLTPLLARLQGTVSWDVAQLDIDDLESATRLRLAALHRSNGEILKAARLELEAGQYALLERRHLKMFDRVFVCSERDRSRLAEGCLHPAPEILPNIVEEAEITACPAHEDFRLLFVGNLSYPPNSDAVLFFCRDILPRIRDSIRRPVTFDIVGGGTPRALAREVSRTAGALLHGRVQDLAPAYARADAAVVPLRTGGGTRIKILEAFAYGRPVISTPVGIEGINAVDGTHALIAEGGQAFADACLRLHREPALGARLAEEALELVRHRYSEAALLDVL